MCSRVAGRGKRTPFDIVNWTLIITTVLWTLIAVFISIFECGIHPEGTWTGLEQLKRMCLNNFLMYAALAVASSIMDLAILIEPLIMVCEHPSRCDFRARTLTSTDAS